MTRILSQGLQYNLVLADGSSWIIAAGDEEAALVVSQLHHAMQMNVTTGSVALSHHSVLRRILVLVNAHKSDASPATCHVPLSSENDDFVVCALHPYAGSVGLFIQLMQLSLIIARDAQARGGVLIHGALAEQNGSGVILAAPGGTGKTTASNRLPAPWNSLCDDTTLVVRDRQGNYWAHPWPTWSSLLWGGSGGSWEVQNAVPLKSIFFLNQALDDTVKRVGTGQAVSLLVECAAQASQLMARGLGKEETCGLHLERFSNLCALARVIPAHVLYISLTGTFWQDIEQTLKANINEKT